MRLVAVYLGESIPKHFWLHVRHLLDIQSKYHLDIVTSKKILEVPFQDPRLHLFNYQPRPEVTQILDSLEMDSKFRDGFWRYTLERLFALTQHHQGFPNESILHIESDLLLLKNFPFQNFTKMEKLIWGRVSANHDVASIIYSPKFQASNLLEEIMLNLISESTVITDMLLLSNISIRYPDLVSTLPSLPKINSDIINKGIKISSDDLESLCEAYSNFEGIFDPAGIGIWLTGTDPRNFFGVTKKFDKKSLTGSKAFIDPGKIKFHFGQKGQLYLLDDGKNIPIYSLHIHSKNLDYFAGDFESFLARDVLGSNVGKTKSTFSIRIFYELIMHNWKKGTLLRFLSWLPILRLTKTAVRRKGCF